MKADYKDWTKEELLKEVQSLQEELRVLQEQFLVEFPWAGNLGQWYWDYEKNDVSFNEKKVKQLGYDPKKLGKIGFEFFTEKLHPEDYERTMDNMRAHLRGETEAYEVEYRIQHKEGHYLWYYDRGSITKRTPDGRPMIVQGIVFDVTESKNIEEQLIEMSEKDELSGFYNRRMLFKRLEQLAAEHSRQGNTFSLIMYDIDHFKKINDTYGHMVGDEVIKELCQLALDEKRDSDQAFRYGGEEFFLLLTNTKKEAALAFAKRLHKKIQALKIEDVGQVTVSMGVVSYSSKESVDSLLKRADRMMYDAKEAGRNQVKS